MIFYSALLYLDIVSYGTSDEVSWGSGRAEGAENITLSIMMRLIKGHDDDTDEADHDHDNDEDGHDHDEKLY